MEKNERIMKGNSNITVTNKQKSRLKLISWKLIIFVFYRLWDQKGWNWTFRELPVGDCLKQDKEENILIKRIHELMKFDMINGWIRQDIIDV